MNKDDVTAADLREARQYLPRGSSAEHLAFAQRQVRARRRVFALLQFYDRHPCHLARIHVLTASSVAIARFCGFSESFNALGEAIMPVDEAGQPRSTLWREYQQACAANRPQSNREELWLEAHALDWQALREAGLDRDFFAEAARHADDPTWQLLRRHCDMTVGTRLFDHLARHGLLPHETTISLSIGLALRRAVGRGWPLFGRFFMETVRALFTSSREKRRDVPTYRRIGFTVLRSALTAWRVWRVYRRGLRIKNRGVCCPEADWPLLETLLGDGVKQVHPLIVRFYRNPGRFTALASLDLRTLPLMVYSRFAALLLGQGLFEGGDAVIPARLRVFRRDNGSMHFIRELFCGATLRVFDSDFVLRTVGGAATLVEVFGDIGVEVVLDAELRPDGGVAIVGRDVYWKGLRLPRTALRIEFASRVYADPDGGEFIEVVGRLGMEPRTAVGRFVMHTLFRRPRHLGSIKYVVRPIAPDGPSES